MVWTEKSRQFTGLIHLDQVRLTVYHVHSVCAILYFDLQDKFVQALRQALTQTARMQQMAMVSVCVRCERERKRVQTSGISILREQNKPIGI